MNTLFKNRTFSGWRGGLNYYNNLLRALSSLQGNRNYLLVEPEPELNIRLDTQYINETVSLSKVKRVSLDWMKRQCLRPFLSESELFVKVNPWIKKIDVLFEVYDRRLNDHLPSIFWIPDFQHVFLSQYFSDEEIKQRNQGFKYIAENADVILVSSNTAKKTCIDLYPKQSDKIEVLHFSTLVPPYLKQIDSDKLLDKYDIEQDFIYLPNQYWKHKNHEVVLEALRSMDRSARPLVISSGPPDDYRNPGHYDRLMDKVAQYELQECYRYIGEIPYKDVMGLICYSKAVINPSHFEGWSTTVQEAKSMNKKLILSDIPVHREQAPSAMFFDPESPQQLAECLEKSKQLLHQPVDISQAEHQSINQMKAMAKYFCDIAETAKEHFRSKK